MSPALAGGFFITAPPRKFPPRPVMWLSAGVLSPEASLVGLGEPLKAPKESLSSATWCLKFMSPSFSVGL